MKDGETKTDVETNERTREKLEKKLRLLNERTKLWEKKFEKYNHN